MFVHEPLLESTKQFRLLRFDLSSTATRLSCRLETFDLTACPAYYALSYVYGDPLLRNTLWVNGKETEVNRNGWQVLQQARSRAAAGSYYWLDAICINQSDLAEKALQVHKIADIFSGATEVWACFGPDRDDSDFLFHALTSFPPDDPSSPIAEWLEERSEALQRRTVNWLAALGDDFGRFAGAMKAFGQRPFFSRTWIYQELHLAYKVMMLCGNAMADMQALKDITLVCTTLPMSTRPFLDYDYKEAQIRVWHMLETANIFLGQSDLDNFDLMVHQVHRKDPSRKTMHSTRPNGLVDIQAMIRDLQCYDARDKIFAVKSLLGSAYSIMPDYTISCYELALQVLTQHSYTSSDKTANRDVELAALLCFNLRLDADLAEVEAAMARNLSTKDFPGMPEYLPGAPMFRNRTAWGCKVSMSPSGHFTAPMITYKSENWVGTQAPSDTASMPTPSEFAGKVCLIVNDMIVAITACEMSDGDWIVPLSDYSTDLGFETYCYGMILRAQGPDMYRVVGEIAFSPYCRPCPASSGDPELCQCVLDQCYHADIGAYFDIVFDSAELLLFSTRLRAPFEIMRQESHYRSRAPPLLPAGPPMQWPSSFAIVYRESFGGEYVQYASTDGSGTACTPQSESTEDTVHFDTDLIDVDTEMSVPV